MEKKNELHPVADAGNAAGKEKYEAPVVEIVEVLVERGFEDSLTRPTDNPSN